MSGPIPPRVLLTYGTFDGMTPAQGAILRQLCAMGTELIVGCTTDALALRLGLACRLPFEQRRALLEANRFVSRVIPEGSHDQRRTDIVNYNVCTLALPRVQAAQAADLNDIAQIIALPDDVTAPAVPVALAG